MTLRNVVQMYGGESPIDGLYGPEARTQRARMDEMLARSTPVEGTDGEHEMNDKVLCRSALTLVHSAPATEAPKDRLIVRFVVSSGEDARDNKHLNVAGIDFRSWDELPIVPWCHLYDRPPVGRGVWRGIYKRGGTYELWSDVEFMPENLADDPWVRFAAAVGKMYAGGWMRGISAGWIPKRIKEIRSKGGRLMKLSSETSEYIEQSCCPLPVDRWALAEAKSRNVITADDVEVIGETTKWRSLTDGVAYELSSRGAVTIPDRSNEGENIDEVLDEMTRAFKANETRELIDERTLDPEDKLTTLVRPGVRAVQRAEGDGEPAAASEPTEPSEPADGTPAEPDETPAAEGDTQGSEGEPDTPESGAEAGSPEPAAEADSPAGGETGEGDSEPSEPTGEPEPEEPAPPLATALAASMRGVVSDEMDLAYDKLRGSVLGMMDATEMLWSLTHQAFFSGRSIAEMLGIPVEKRQATAAGEPHELPAMVDRQLKRIDGQAQGIRDAVEMFRDAIHMEEGDDGDTAVEVAGLEDAISLALEFVDAETRAGKKIRLTRRERLGEVKEMLAKAAKLLGAVLQEPEVERKAEKSKPKAKAGDGEKNEPENDERALLLAQARGLKRRLSGEEDVERSTKERLGSMGKRASAFLDRLADRDRDAQSEREPEPEPTTKRGKPRGPLPHVAVPSRTNRTVGEEFTKMIGERLSALQGGGGEGGSQTPS